MWRLLPSVGLRSLAEAKMMRNSLGPIVTAGKVHLLRLFTSSLRYQPLRLAEPACSLKISIQSLAALSSSSRVDPLLATSSLIRSEGSVTIRVKLFSRLSPERSVIRIRKETSAWAPGIEVATCRVSPLIETRPLSVSPAPATNS